MCIKISIRNRRIPNDVAILGLGETEMTKERTRVLLGKTKGMNIDKEDELC